MNEYRSETDSMGEVKVPADTYYGAQTARSLVFFNIGREQMPRSMIRSLGMIKKSPAQVNEELHLLDSKKAHAIVDEDC